MASEHARRELERMYMDLTDDDTIAENKKKFERTKHLEDKKRDTGLL